MSKGTLNYKVISIVLAVVLVAGVIFVGVTRLAPEPEEPVAEVPVPVPAPVPAPAPVPVPVQVPPAVEGELARIIPGVPRNEVLIVDALHGRLADPGNFNHWRAGVSIGNGLHQMLADTFWYVEGQTMEIINSLAAGPPEYNEDYTEMTINLRQGVYWSDGVPFTADDVVFTANTIKATTGLILNAEMNRWMESIEKIDDYTVRFHLTAPNPSFHLHLTVMIWSTMRVMPKHIMEGVPNILEFRNDPAVSLGPYTMKSFDPAGYWWLYEKRDDWERTTTGILFGEPKPQYVLFIFYGDDEKKIMAQARNELDLIFDLMPEGWEVLRERNPNSRVWFEDFPWAWMDEMRARKMHMNHKVFPFDNRDVRWALTLSSDITEIITTAFGGIGRMNPLDVVASTKLMERYYEPLLPWLEEFELEDGYRPWDPDVAYALAEYGSRKYGVTIDEPTAVFGKGWWRYDPAQAARMLERHGFERDARGRWLLPDGTPWELTILAPAGFEIHATRLAFAVADQWEKFGIDVDVETIEAGPFWTRWNVGDFQVFAGWHTPSTDLHPLIPQYHSRFLRPIGEVTALNHVRWTNPEVDEIIEELEGLHPDDPRAVELRKEYLMLQIEDMVSPTFIVNKKFNAQDHTVWTGFPNADNPFQAPVWWFSQFKFLLPFLELAGN